MDRAPDPEPELCYLGMTIQVFEYLRLTGVVNPGEPHGESQDWDHPPP